jgi:hypothetical protein
MKMIRTKEYSNTELVVISVALIPGLFGAFWAMTSGYLLAGIVIGIIGLTAFPKIAVRSWKEYSRMKAAHKTPQ